MADTTQQIGESIDALMQEYYTVTHNLANVSTVGYKRRYNAFVKALMEQQQTAQAEPSSEITATTQLDFSQGGLEQTGRKLDFALHGKGFFVVETPQGPLYTRNGVFHTNRRGQIVDSDGRTIAGQAGPIVIPSAALYSKLHVSKDGTFTAGTSAIGRFRLVDFGENEQNLLPAGKNCFAAPADILPAPAENVVVQQGCRESSNVQSVDELVQLIMVTRLYESNMKTLAVTQENTKSILGVAG